jgi:uncharacterized membrane protein
LTGERCGQVWADEEGSVFDLVSRSADDPRTFFDGAYWLIGLGILGALAAAVFGLLDWRGNPGARPRASRRPPTWSSTIWSRQAQRWWQGGLG